MITGVSLFAGVGGFDLAMERNGVNVELDLRGQRAAFLVERDQALGQRLQAPAGERCIKAFRIFTDLADIVHGPGLCLTRPRKTTGPEAQCLRPRALRSGIVRT